MKTITGDACPLLFDKWKPNKTEILYEDDSSRIYQKHHFDFCYVDIESNDIYSPTRFVSARGTTCFPGQYTPERLFEPEILEMYTDAKEFMKKKLKQFSKIHPEFGIIDIDSQSVFGRGTGFQVSADYNKLLCGVKNVIERNLIVHEVYHSLEDHLRTEFGLLSEEIEPYFVIGISPAGNQKTVEIVKGIFLNTENPLNDEINAGRLCMRLIADEHGNMKDYDAILNSCYNFINKNYQSKLMKMSNGVVSRGGLSGDGNLWKIDLSNIKISNKLSSTILAGMIENK
jgi:hypothetical protein